MKEYSLEKANQYTNQQLISLRNALHEKLNDSSYKNDICVVVTGSYGRGEASEESDIDWYIIFDKDRDINETIPNEIESIRSIIRNHTPNAPGDTGIFDNAVKFSDMQKNIGGEHDTNQTLTRRMLFLLEGTYIFNEDRFNYLKKELLKKYIKSTDVKENVSRFLLNDIIRYYRTITTDFEYKVTEANKSWGLRNIKLKFSRKILYFSGILTAAELYNLSYEERLEKANELLALQPLERIKKLPNNKEILIKYQNFLIKISNPKIRECLNKVTKDDRKENNTYVELSLLANKLSADLIYALNKKYDSNHPIHSTLVI